MNIDVYNTHIEVYPYAKDDFPIIEEMYTATDKYTGKDYPCGYLIDNSKLYLPRGTSIARLESLTEARANYLNEADEWDDMESHVDSLYDPRDDFQEACIRFLKGPETQLSLNAATGLGKTFCVCYAINQLKIKALIITPNEGLKQQWINTFHKMIGFRANKLINIAGSNIMDAIMDDLVKPADIYFVNHQTLRSYLSQNNGYKLHQFFKKLKVGVKVYDESHMEFANILLMDFFSNTRRTWYLTATFDRSDKTESVCFKRAFNSVIGYGETQSEQVVRKHVIYHVVNINSRISPKHRAWLLGYPAFTAAKYGKYAFFDDPSDTAYKAILKILDKIKNVEGKIMIFVPLIDAVDRIVKDLKKDFPEKSVGAYHSKMSKDEKDDTERKKDIIVSTIKSCGTGKDIKGLRNVICLEPVASKVVIQQMIGRLRPYAPDKDTYYWDVVDRSIPPMTWWFRGRMKKAETLVKKVVNIDL
jgi:superfamily II DNA or RNA helicase